VLNDRVVHVGVKDHEDDFHRQDQHDDRGGQSDAGNQALLEFTRDDLAAPVQ